MKIPLRYQMSEYDCGPTSMLNAISYLFEREEIPPRLVPNGPMTPAARWTVQPEEIDANGHLNNVHYIRHAQALVRADATAMDIVFSYECFAGETLTLQTGGDGFVRGVKETGKESFCARFLEGVTL